MCGSGVDLVSLCSPETTASVAGGVTPANGKHLRRRSEYKNLSG
jgi:hypothetical protein